MLPAAHVEAFEPRGVLAPLDPRVLPAGAARGRHWQVGESGRVRKG